MFSNDGILKNIALLNLFPNPAISWTENALKIKCLNIYYGKVAQLFTPFPHISHFNKIGATIYIWKVKFCVTILILHQISEQRWHRDTICTKATFVITSSCQSSFDRSRAFSQTIESKLLNQLTSVCQLQQPLFSSSNGHSVKMPSFGQPIWVVDTRNGVKHLRSWPLCIDFSHLRLNPADRAWWSFPPQAVTTSRGTTCTTSHVRPRNLTKPTY